MQSSGLEIRPLSVEGDPAGADGSGAATTVSRVTSVAELDLDLDVFQGPFDLLLAVLLREEISLAEVPLGEIVVAYVDHMGDADEVDLDLEAVTEFLVLIAALCELKSRLLLPTEEGDDELGPQEAADELLARMLEYRRYSEAAGMLHERLEREGGVMYRSGPLPPRRGGRDPPGAAGGGGGGCVPRGPPPGRAAPPRAPPRAPA